MALIERIRRRAAKAGEQKGVRLGIGDDAAVLRPPRGADVVVTTDFSLEGRHFRRDRHPARAIGHRALARGLSDLAAMGARPLAAFLSLALPREVARDTAWVDGLLDGLLALARATGTPLAGGDTAEAPGAEVLIDIVLTGAVPAGTALRRDGARPGDGLYVTGWLGGAAAELEAVLGGQMAEGSGGHPHLFPQPRLAAGEALRRRGLATACMDLSDGLSTDLAHLCRASGVRAEVELERLPLDPLALAGGLAKALAQGLHGGEDYELLFTAGSRTRVPRRLGGVAVTRIGTILPAGRRRPLVQAVRAEGRVSPLEPGGWEHLR